MVAAVYKDNFQSFTRIIFKVKSPGQQKWIMAASTSFASPQMDWDALDPITAFVKSQQKCQLMLSSVLKDPDGNEKLSYIPLWLGEKGLLASSLLRRSRRTVRYLSSTAWWHAKTTPYEPLFTGNQHTLTDYLTKRPTILLRTKRLWYEPWQVEHKLFSTQTAVWSSKSSTWTLFSLRTTTTLISSNATYIRQNDSSNNSYPSTATIPYIRGISETIARILRHYNIRVAPKPMFTFRSLLTNVKGKDKAEDKPGTVYKITCSDCYATYIGGTGRNLTTRLNEQKAWPQQ